MLRKDSFSKMITWFKDGNVRTMYSIDWTNRYSVRDRQIGLQRFREKVTSYGDKARYAAVYDVATGNTLCQFVEGKEIPVRRRNQTQNIKSAT